MIASVCVHSHCSCTQAFILESSWIDIPVGSLAHLVHQRHELRPCCCVKQKPLKADGQTKLTCMVGGLTFNHPADHWVWISFESSRSTTIKSDHAAHAAPYPSIHDLVFPPAVSYGQKIIQKNHQNVSRLHPKTRPKKKKKVLGFCYMFPIQRPKIIYIYIYTYI